MSDNITSASVAPTTTSSHAPDLDQHQHRVVADGSAAVPGSPLACERILPESKVNKSGTAAKSATDQDPEDGKRPTANEAVTEGSSATSDQPTRSTAVDACEEPPKLEPSTPLYTSTDSTSSHTSNTEQPPESTQHYQRPPQQQQPSPRPALKQPPRINTTRSVPHSPALDHRHIAEDQRHPLRTNPRPTTNPGVSFVATPTYPPPFYPQSHDEHFLPGPNWNTSRPGIHNFPPNFNPMPHATGHVPHPPSTPVRNFSPYNMQGNTPSSAVSSVAPRQIRPGPRKMALPEPMGDMPLTGYDLLAAKLCGAGDGRPPISPLYRRFAGLQHRVLLGLQDELSALEEQLQALDTADSKKRRFSDGYIPASRRHELFEPDELSTQRGELLERISFKLYQYRCQLEGWKKTAAFAEPDPGEIHRYKAYLDSSCPVVPTEARFIEAEDDLVALDRLKTVEGHSTLESPRTPTMRSRSCSSTLYSPSASVGETSPKAQRHENKVVRTNDPTTNVKLLMLGFGVAIVFPTLTFPFIPIFMGRMAIVFFSGLAVLVTFIQTGAVNFVQEGNITDATLLAAVYGIVMALVAGTSN